MFGIPLHRLIIYFPVGLVVVSFVYDARALSSGKIEQHKSGFRLLVLATLSAIVAAASGFVLAGVSGLGSGGPVTGHAGSGSVATLILVVFAFLRYSAGNREDVPGESYNYAWLGGQFLAAVLVLATAVLGFQI